MRYIPNEQGFPPPTLPAAPSVMVESSPSSVHILNISPYNQFTVTCNVSAEVEGETLPLEMTVYWVRKAEASSDQPSFSAVPSTKYVTTGSPEDGYQSILTTTETDTMKKVLYRCRARFIPERSIQGYNETTLEVQGMNHYEFVDKRCISGSSIEMYSLVLIFYYNNNIHTTQTYRSY